MLWTVLPTSLAEQLANSLLQLDEGSTERLASLAGRRIRLTLAELGQPLTMTVTESELLLSWVDQEAVDCHIMTRLAVLPELRDRANITRLIKADALDIEGDPMLAQQLSKLFTELDIDWPEQLSRRIGDVPTQFLLQAWRRSRRWFNEVATDQQQWLRDVLIEEKKLTPSRTEYELFSDEVQQLRAAVDRLERSLSQIRGR
ncbi:ubiquinone biosynthesis accessory factor UbiJ [Pseudidiomarina taiwanensis]|uniref:Ubiquinone biosynthesis accessory factor UbiJ n=1 Tax=Pseudidiomarina taiwanensis TaxID=337250 RepID=A0A432ZFU6_9GAMM|nr:SCP2 sterol-binding domain-containing protein [Pseudidiomarina taiwanensis]RUO76774.1 hypothetical protein CWI83_07575 [Pseudidiomarina taiwanensis]